MSKQRFLSKRDYPAELRCRLQKAEVGATLIVPYNSAMTYRFIRNLHGFHGLSILIMQAEHALAEAAKSHPRPESAKTEGMFVTGFAMALLAVCSPCNAGVAWLGQDVAARCELHWASALSAGFSTADMLGWV